jgi:probable rRNA maturation factor
MKLLFRNMTKLHPVSPVWVARLSQNTLRVVKGKAFARGSEISIVWVGDAEMRRLNKAHRGKDKTTDVLSFPLLEGKKMTKAPKGSLPLGDIVVSLPQTLRQARERGVAFEMELALLVVHGILHLLGYDHGTLAEEKRMFALQRRILKSF